MERVHLSGLQGGPIPRFLGHGSNCEHGGRPDSKSVFNLLISKSSLATKAIGVYGGWTGAALALDAMFKRTSPRSARVGKSVKARRIMLSYKVGRKD